MRTSLIQAAASNFLGNAPGWYKRTIAAFLLLNPLLLIMLGPFTFGWLLVLEFIFCLVMALKCYPLQPGGLLALEAVLLGLTAPATVFHETHNNLPVILLLIFMVAGIYFLKDLLLFIFTRILMRIRSKTLLSLVFCVAAAVLSAFLDALTVTAVIITVAIGFYGVYHRVLSGHGVAHHGNLSDDSTINQDFAAELDDFRKFLRNLMMHGAVGTALGGVTTLVGEPQNLLIGQVMGWHFGEFFIRLAPVSLPVFAAGLLTCWAVERFALLGYGAQMPDSARRILQDWSDQQTAERSDQQKARLVMQGAIAAFLVVALAFHWAEVGLIGLSVIVLASASCGIIREQEIGKAFSEALPFTALLVVFFAVVGVIHDQHLFVPVIEYVFSLDKDLQVPMFYLANGLLSAISDNVFVATVYINEVSAAMQAGEISQQQFELLAIAINTGTNIPSVATPNGQAAFLFLLTSTLAPLIRLNYMSMVMLALPYTVVMSITGFFSIALL